MRAALISLPQSDSAAQPPIAGKTVAERQLLFAREVGCEMAFAHGGGASEQAIRLRHMAERIGMRFQTVSNAHALAGSIGSGDSLLVMQPGLLPEARQALELLRADGDRALVMSAGPGTSAGLERIDLDRAWGGALTIPGSWLGSLTDLPEDAAPHAALLRIALQKGLPEARLDDAILDDGRWTVVTGAEAAVARQSGWLRSYAGKAPATSPSRWLARFAVTRAGAWMLERRWTRPVAFGFFAFSLAGAVAAAFHDRPVAAYGLLALSVPLLEVFLALSRLVTAPFGRLHRLPLLRHAIDAALLGIGFMAVDGLWYRAAFPPFVLVAALILLDRKRGAAITDLARDRGLVAAAVAILSALAMPEIALVLVATIVLLAALLPSVENRG